jgi:phage FluMu gp28-like protein
MAKLTNGLTAKESAELERLLSWKVWAANPWEWIKDCIWTIDETDGTIKRFPDKEYFAYVVNAWQESSILAIPKSRRMMATWLFLALHLWAALFRSNSAVFIQSQKSSKSEWLVGNQRMWFMYENLPKQYTWPKPIRLLKGEGGISRVELNNGSYIMAIGEGADQFRQYTASHVMLDEVAFWEKAKESYTGTLPTIQGGGKVVLISTADPGFFEEVVTGRME